MLDLQSVQWGEFRIGDLFEKVKTKKLPYKAGDLPKLKCDKYCLPALTASNTAQGLAVFTPMDEATIISNAISVSANGSPVAFYQPHQFTVLQDAYALKARQDLSSYQLLFLVTLISKAIKDKYDWNNKSGWERVKHDIIHLPTLPDGTPDFAFMEAYIKELEQECIQELDAYLKATGLDDPMLTPEEQKALDDFEKVAWGEFHLYDIFKIESGSKVDKNTTSSKNPKYNYISRTALNNGVSAIIDELPNKKLYKKGSITLALGGSLGSCFTQTEPFYTSQNVAVLIPDGNMSDKAKAFIATSIHKSASHGYQAFMNELNKHIKTDFTFLLPIFPDGTPDYAFMETYIRATQKLSIRDVVAFRDDQQIALTKQVSSKPTPSVGQTA